MSKYRKKPIEVEAVLFDGHNYGDVLNLRGSCRTMLVDGKVGIETLEGTMTANPGDYIIKGVAGELYPCKPEIFLNTYEQA